MAVLRWRIPSFNRRNSLTFSTTIDIENHFLTSYGNTSECHDEFLTALKELSDEDRRYYEWYFGNLASDIYYVLYEREYLTGSEHESKVNEVIYLDTLCDEIDSYVLGAKDILRRLDGQFHDVSLSEGSTEAISEGNQERLLELLQGLGRRIRDYGSTLGNGENSLREIGSPGTTDVIGILDDIRDVLYLEHPSWSADCINSLGTISQFLQLGDKRRARREYRQLFSKMGSFYQQRFLLVLRMQKRLSKSAHTERRLALVLKDSDFENLFLQFRTNIINHLEATLFKTLSSKTHLNEAIVTEKIANLRNAIAEIDFDSGDKNLGSYYFKEKELKEHTGPCFALLQIEGRAKDLVAFCGVYDGSAKIARFFRSKGGTSGAESKHRAFIHSFNKIRQSDGFCSQFEQVSITDNVEFFFDGGTKSLTLKEVMQKAKGDVAEERMFSCCERKLFQNLNHLSSRFPLSTCTLIVKRQMCQPCYDGLVFYEQKLGITIKVAPSVFRISYPLKNYNDYVTFARRIMNSTKPKSITSFP